MAGELGHMFRASRAIATTAVIAMSVQVVVGAQAAATLLQRPSSAGRTLRVGPSDLDTVNVRREPHIKSDVVGKVRPGETYTFSQVRNGWYWLDAWNGWLAGRYAIVLGPTAPGPLPLEAAPLSRTLPESLRNGTEAYLNGHYAEVLEVLTPEAVADTEMPFRLHAHAMRAAASFARFVYSGATDLALLAQARQDADACRALDSYFRPNPAVFSPRFIAFFMGGAGTP